MTQTYRYIALFLLVIFSRALVPDALLLELHAHQHTEHAESVVHTGDLPLLDGEHLHCAADQVFQVPFQLISFSFGGAPLSFTDNYAARLHPLWDFVVYGTPSLRGPPTV